MKKLLLILTVLAAGFVAAPNAEARPYHNHGANVYVSGHTACGCPIYTQRYISHYDCYRRPVFAYRTVRVDHHCRRNNYYQQQRHQHNGYNYTRSGVRIGPVIVSPRYSHGRCR